MKRSNIALIAYAGFCCAAVVAAVMIIAF